MKTIQELNRMPDCPICGNLRKIEFEDRILGKRYKNCKCTNYYKQLRFFLEDARIPSAYKLWDWDDYKPNVAEGIEEEGNRAVVKSLKEYLKRPAKKMNLLFSGPPVCGKTLLASIFMRELMLKHHYSGKFVNNNELVMLAYDYTNFKITESETGLTFEELVEVDVLFIEGYDKLQAKINTMSEAFIGNLIKQRVFRNKGHILTANKNYKQLTAAGGYTTDLINSVKYYRMFGTYKA